jgi:hypothetical protein
LPFYLEAQFMSELMGEHPTDGALRATAAAQRHQTATSRGWPSQAKRWQTESGIDEDSSIRRLTSTTGMPLSTAASRSAAQAPIKNVEPTNADAEDDARHEGNVEHRGADAVGVVAESPDRRN